MRVASPTRKQWEEMCRSFIDEGVSLEECKSLNRKSIQIKSIAAHYEIPSAVRPDFFTIHHYIEKGFYPGEDENPDDRARSCRVS